MELEKVYRAKLKFLIIVISLITKVEACVIYLKNSQKYFGNNTKVKIILVFFVHKDSFQNNSIYCIIIYL